MLQDVQAPPPVFVPALAMPRRRPGRKSKAAGVEASRPPRRPAKLGPTPEVAARRRLLAGKGDPDLTSCWLDIIHTRGLIDEHQHAAGRRYAYLRCSLYGVPFPRSTSDGLRAGRELCEGEVAAMARDHARLCKALGDDPHARAEVDKVAVYDRPAHWLIGAFGLARPSGTDESDRQALLRGLDALAKVLGYKQPKS